MRTKPLPVQFEHGGTRHTREVFASQPDQGVVAENCDSVTLMLVAATSYNGPHRSPSLDGKDPATLCDDYLQTLFRPGSDPSLAALYFQFGRYLLVAGSRPGTQPLNLQGIWNKDINPAWSANWTLHCNAQINYWPVEAANLAECHEPLMDLTTELSIDGTNIAKHLYGARGWIAHHNRIPLRTTSP